MPCGQIEHRVSVVRSIYSISRLSGLQFLEYSGLSTAPAILLTSAFSVRMRINTSQPDTMLVFAIIFYSRLTTSLLNTALSPIVQFRNVSLHRFYFNFSGSLQSNSLNKVLFATVQAVLTALALNNNFALVEKVRRRG